MLNDTLPQVLPTLVCLGILARLRVEDIRGAQLLAKFLGSDRPPVELRNGEKLKQLGFDRYLCIARVAVDAVQEVGLLVVVGCEDDEVDDALKYLGILLDGEL